MKQINKTLNDNSKEIIRINETIDSLSRKMDFHLSKMETLKTKKQINTHQSNIEFLQEVRLMLSEYKQLKQKTYGSIEK